MAPATEYQGSFLSRISIRRNQIVSMDVNHEQELQELESFQKYVAERFLDLISPPLSSASDAYGGANSPSSDPILSISWLRKLLDVFMSCEAEFKTVLITGPGPGPGRDPSQISKPPLDRVVPEMLDRVVKALDICTAVVNGVDSVRNYQRLAEIAVTALKQRPLSDGSVRRAKRALDSLLNALNVERDRNNGGSSSGRRTTERSWSFSHRNGGPSGGSYVSKNWSAAKQIQAMAANLIAPRGTEASGLALLVQIMSTIMVLVMWVLVAAVPCQGSNGLATHLPLPKQQIWASAVVDIHERIGEEMKRKERRGCRFSGGVMEEMQRMERIGIGLMEFTERFRFPAEEEEEVAEKVVEMAEVCQRMEGLNELQRQVREVFHRMVRSRTEILEALNQAGRNSM